MKMIFDSKVFWKECFSVYMIEVMCYFCYMFNDYLFFVFVIGFGVGIFYYVGWVKMFEFIFFVILLMVILFIVLIVISFVVMLLKKLDIVYLIVQEKVMDSYFI